MLLSIYQTSFVQPVGVQVSGSSNFGGLFVHLLVLTGSHILVQPLPVFLTKFSLFILQILLSIASFNSANPSAASCLLYWILLQLYAGNSVSLPSLPAILVEKLIHL